MGTWVLYSLYCEWCNGIPVQATYTCQETTVKLMPQPHIAIIGNIFLHHKHHYHAARYNIIFILMALFTDLLSIIIIELVQLL